MTEHQQARVAIASGYFNPLHVGHLRMMHEASAIADHLVVIVNNDDQQLVKSGKVIQPLDHRIEIVRALRVVDDVVPAIDADGTVRATLAQLRDRYPSAHLLFVQGGDRSDPTKVAELDTCIALEIELVFAVGGSDKADASSRINRALG